MSQGTPAKARRDYGSGTVFQRANGKWIGRFSAGWTRRGTRRRISVVADTEAAARRALRHRMREWEESQATTANPRTTVKGWAEEWLPLVEREQRPASFANTRSAIDRWILPTIGHHLLIELAPAHVRAVISAQRAAGRSTSTMRRTHSVLTQLLKAARAEGHNVAPRVLEVPPPTTATNDRTAMTTAQAIAVLEQAGELPHGSRWLAALLQGMRQGECLGLTWDAVDLERGLLVLSHQLRPLPYNVPHDIKSGFRIPDGYKATRVRGRWHLVPPKSTAGIRVIPLVGPMRDALTSWRTIAPPNRHGLVWPRDGDVMKTDAAEWAALQAAAGVHHPTRLTKTGDPAPYTVHEARHTTATLLLEAGVDPTVITAILGHTSILTSRGYMHVRTDSAAEALEKVAHRLALA